MSALYTAHAHVVGGRDGHGETDDGLLKVDLRAPKSLGGPGNGTNPEQLFAIGYAACFESAIRHIARQQKLGLTSAAVNSTVELHATTEGGFRLAVALEAEIGGLDEAAAKALVARAHEVCPYSNAIRGNVDVTPTVKVQ